MGFVCPACEYPDLEEEPWSASGFSSFEICPQCGIQFGYHDAAGGHADAREEIYAKWRQKWAGQTS
jgi:hypothetical protein